MQATNHNSDLEPGATTFAGKLAVVTGGGSGMGRALVRQLAAEGCSVAACDWHADPVADAATAARADALGGTLVTAHTCDVSDEEQVGRFRDELLRQHATDHVDLVFSNAGIGGGASFVKGGREEWDRTFAVNWWGVYNCARTFLPLLIASGDGVIVNTSSVNGFWAALGPGMPNSAYATAKFAIRGFTESLIEDLRSNAPAVRAVLVMPGHVGTDILANTRRAHGRAEPRDMSDAVIQETIPADAREGLIRAGLLRKGASTDDLRRLLEQFETDFRDKAPVTAEAAATTILDGVRTGKWRILIGRDAATLDSVIRAHPEAAYDYNELFKLAKEEAERTASAV
ncbi:MAG TPA: SDR family oxidoreductase [Solirubrobacteraceae bacterium]|nr:SDR family oxidoreductase [Solirubrobacteraceae bacterium]